MKSVVFSLGLLLCAHQLLASLGDTETDLVKRYGKVQGSFVSETGKFSTDEFDYLNFHISVTLLGGISNREVITRKDKKSLDSTEMQSFLDANSLGSKWEQKDDDKSVIIWVLESRQAFAGYYKENTPSPNTLVIKTPDMLAFEEAAGRLMEQQQQQQQQSQALKQDPTKNRSMQP